MKRFSQQWLAVFLFVFLAGAPGLRAADAPPSFKEVYDLLKAHLVEADDAKLDRAAMEGLLRRLAPQAMLVTNGQAAPKPEGPMLSKTQVYDGAFGYLRVARVETGLAKETGEALAGLASSNKIKGWVLDLRFADGLDYKAATEVAERFVATEQPLLDWGQGVIRSKKQENAVKVPVTVLVNRETSSAAEALAAMLRKTDVALLLGTNTAGRAFIAKDLPLKNGQQLRVATAWVKLGDGEALPLQGVKPDIQVTVSASDEKAYFEDAYQVPPRSALAGAVGLTDTNLTASSTNRPRHRVNEAELVRMQRDGQDPDEERLVSLRSIEPAKPVVRDPALARALDLLKGLAVVRRAK